MGRRKEAIARGSHETLASRVQWLWENRSEIPVSMEPGPAGQFYFADWLSDGIVRRMSSSARGVHMDSLCSAWLEHPPCSWPASEEDLEDLIGDLDQVNKKRFMKAWHIKDGRIWQPGLCKTYLVQIRDRISKAIGGFKTQKNDDAVALLGNVLETIDAEQFQFFEEVENSSAQAKLQLGGVLGGVLEGSSSSSSSSSSGSPSSNPQNTQSGKSEPRGSASSLCVSSRNQGDGSQDQNQDQNQAIQGNLALVPDLEISSPVDAALLLAGDVAETVLASNQDQPRKRSEVVMVGELGVDDISNVVFTSEMELGAVKRRNGDDEVNSKEVDSVLGSLVPDVVLPGGFSGPGTSLEVSSEVSFCSASNLALRETLVQEVYKLFLLQRPGWFKGVQRDPPKDQQLRGSPGPLACADELASGIPGGGGNGNKGRPRGSARAMIEFWVDMGWTLENFTELFDRIPNNDFLTGRVDARGNKLSKFVAPRFGIHQIFMVNDRINVPMLTRDNTKPFNPF